MDRPRALADAAIALVGTPFRLQGRDPAHGLDCIGLVIASLAQVGIRLPLPADYQPRRRNIAVPHAALHAAGLIEAASVRRAGDIVLLRSAPAQAHAAIAVGREDVVHAHAGFGRVVRSTLPETWSVLAAWRLGPDGDCQWPR